MAKLPERLASAPAARVPGTAIYLARVPNVVPHALLLNLHHNKVVHERLVFLGIATDTRAYVADHERVQVEQLWPNIYRVSAKFGFAEDPEVPVVLDLARRDGIQIDAANSTFFMGREILIATERPGMAIWRERLYARLARNARRATRYFKIPSNRVVELGAEIEL